MKITKEFQWINLILPGTAPKKIEPIGPTAAPPADIAKPRGRRLP
jgi:hypothetical protein